MRRQRRSAGRSRGGRLPFGTPPGMGMPPFPAPSQGEAPAFPAAPLVAEVDRGKCIGCNRCARVCPAGAIQFDADGKAVVNPQLCRGCAACVGVCPVEAIRMVNGSTSGGAQSRD